MCSALDRIWECGLLQLTNMAYCTQVATLRLMDPYIVPLIWHCPLTGLLTNFQRSRRDVLSAERRACPVTMKLILITLGLAIQLFCNGVESFVVTGGHHPCHDIDDFIPHVVVPDW